MAGNVTIALVLTSLGAAGTALGGLLVVAQPDMSFRRLGLLQGLAAGLMLCISMVDLLPASIETVGFARASVWFYGGVAFFALVTALVPEPNLDSMIKGEDEKNSKDGDDDKGRKADRKHRREVLFSGLMTALGITLHNFPEGVSVFLASMKSTAMGVTLAVAIALHNIPEGVAVALPVYFATKSRWEGFKYAAVSGLAEPLAVVILGLCFPVEMSRDLVELMLAGVGGIMAFLSFHELLPLSIQHAGKTGSVAAVFVGMAIMSLNLFLLDHWLGVEH
ncbi:hypothetical protein BSKO_05360 [Bryopsis sp. KO-2023]|nr:hypothetical protein BSKO_05360 [Bryopsis sp. KO-2023]